MYAIWSGKSPEDLPIVQNKNGPRLINARTLKKIGLALSPAADGLAAFSFEINRGRIKEDQIQTAE